jgi:predicted outer membrane repeat protein
MLVANVKLHQASVLFSTCASCSSVNFLMDRPCRAALHCTICHRRQTTFADNSATNGGGIAAYNTSFLGVDASTLQRNNASEYGGALLIWDEAQVRLGMHTFTTVTVILSVSR